MKPRNPGFRVSVQLSSLFPPGGGIHIPWRTPGCIAGCLLMTAVVFAKDSSVSYSVSSTHPHEHFFSPYVVGFVGFENPRDPAYRLVFTKPMMMPGAGFGVRTPWVGTEFLIRQGSNEEAHIIIDTNRNFSVTSTDIQARLFVPLTYKKWTLPAGIGFGMLRMTVDRGYSGDFDSFSGDGFYFGPFVGAQYPIGKNFYAGVEIEYSLSSASFTSNQTWENQYGQRLDGLFPVTEDDFWDTVGGGSTQDYDNGGIVISVRVSFDLPRIQLDRKERSD
jgi:hypothetical protein